MQFRELRNKLEDFRVFTLSDIRKIEPDFHRARLSEWQDKGYIKKLRRGYYIFADETLSEKVLFLIANQLYEPSYVSLEMAFSRYNLIPEAVYSVTSVTSKKTMQFETPITTFVYRSVKPELMFGYRLEGVGKQKYKLAEVEKAVLDYLYLNSSINNESAFAGLRFNSEAFLRTVNLETFTQYARAFGNKSLEKRADDFITFLKQTT